MIDSKQFPMIPKIKDGTISSVNESAKDKKFIKDGWTQMLEEDPNLFSCITETCKKIPERKMKEGFLRGCWLVWALYNSQDEADQMNKEWGL